MAPVVSDAIAAIIATLPPVAAPDAAGYGTDLVCLDDIDPGAAMLDPLSPAGIGQALYHRLSVKRDATCIREEDPSLGYDLVGLLHKGVTQKQIAQLETAVAAECIKDDRVLSADVTLTWQPGGAAGDSWAVAINVVPVDPLTGNFSLVLSVTSGQVLFDALEAR